MSTKPLHQHHPLPNHCAFCGARKRALCGVLSAEGLEEYKGYLSRAHADTGQHLFHENDKADYLYTVVSGCIKVYKSLPDGRRQVVGFMMQGDTIGIARNGNYTYSAQATTPSNLCRLALKDLPQMQKKYPEFASRMLEQAQERIEAAEAHMVLLGRKSAVEKLASFLLELALRKPMCIGEEPHNLPLNLPMNRTDIADFLGLTTESVSRTFTQLKNKDIIGIEGQHIVILKNVEVLKQIEQGC